jgi:hypothetical protein
MEEGQGHFTGVVMDKTRYGADLRPGGEGWWRSTRTFSVAIVPSGASVMPARMVRSITECGGKQQQIERTGVFRPSRGRSHGRALRPFWADAGQAFDSDKQRIEFERAHAPVERQICCDGKADNCSIAGYAVPPTDKGIS